MNIGAKIKELMESNDTNANELARQIGVTPSTIYSLIQRDSGRIKIDLLIDVSHALGVTVDELLDLSVPSDLSLSPLERQVVLSFRACSPERQDIILELLSIKKSPEEDSSSSSKKEA